MVKKDYYKILGVSKENTPDEIKKTYKRLALKFHPDRAPEDKKSEYEEKFKEMSEAYAVLSDSIKRQQYDQFGHESINQRYSQEDIFRQADFSDIFQEIFEGGLHSQSSRKHYQKGRDLRYNLTISFEESVTGIKKEIRYNKNVSCKICEGTGAKGEEIKECNICNGKGSIKITKRTLFGIINQEVICEECLGDGKIPKIKCNNCSGKGFTKEHVKFNIEIPAGVDNENVLIVSNGGDEIGNGQAGDLQIVFKIIPHKLFHREDDDIHLTQYINFSQAALGDKIFIPTPYGKTKIKIHSGFESGTIMRLQSKGMENINRYSKGDLYVKINIKTPKSLNRKQKNLFKELAKLEEE